MLQSQYSDVSYFERQTFAKTLQSTKKATAHTSRRFLSKPQNLNRHQLALLPLAY